MTAITATPTKLAPDLNGLPVREQEDDLKQRIMGNRDATYPEVYTPANLISPSRLTDGSVAANRLAKALLLKERITAVADFDSDGATACAVLIRGLSMLSHALSGATKAKTGGTPGLNRATLNYVIPDRFIYGYGLKPELAENVIRPLRPDVIVTLDNGISSNDAVDVISTWKGVSEASLKAGGAGNPDVIITDHHAQGKSLPDAYAVVNPNRHDCEFPSKALCGCGVAFYMLLLTRRALITILGPNPRFAGLIRAVSEVQLNRLSDLVAVGTIGDMVPMDANNRLLVKTGLDRINKGYQMPARQAHEQGYLSYGIRALLEAAKVTHPVSASDIAFQCTPRLNAVGRMEVPTSGIECLLAETQLIADMEAKRCHKLNEERKKVQKEMEAQANETLDAMDLDAALDDSSPNTSPSDRPTTQNEAVVLFDPSWHQGIVGLVASRIKDRTGGAVVCFAPEGDPNDPDNPGDPDWLKGSCRSDNVHIRDALAYVAAQAPDLHLQFGGHHRAAGLGLHRTDLNRFKKLFYRAVAHGLATAPLHNAVFDDGALPAQLRTHSLAAWIERQPWGQMFPEPTFTQDFRVVRSAQIGDHHQKLFVVDPDTTTEQEPFPVLWFFSVDKDTPAIDPGPSGVSITLTYQLTINRFRGSNTLQGIARSVERPIPVFVSAPRASEAAPPEKALLESVPTCPPAHGGDRSEEPKRSFFCSPNKIRSNIA